jgi:translation initiation factor 6 (eIF-6)
VKKIYKRDKLLMKNHVNWNKIEQIENKDEIKIRVIQKKSNGIKNLILYYAHII